VARFGPLPFDDFMELALYAPGAGFYETGGAAGARGGDFITSPEVGPLFGAVLARALDAWWEGLGRPDPFVVVEAAAGRGALCRAVLDAAPACAPALRYLLVERSERLRALQPSLVPVEPAFDVLGPMAPADEEDVDGARALPGHGPRVASLPALPAGPLVGVVVANELLDNLPVSLLAWSGSSWSEVRVGHDLAEVLVPAAPALAEEAARLVGGAMAGMRAGARIPLQHRAAAWVRDACSILSRGRVVAVDYAVDDTASLARRPWRAWLRTYRGGGPGGGPLDAPGTQDVTCEVCIDQLARARPLAACRTQAELLDAYGLAALVDEARAAWQARAADGGLAALAARSRLSEADAITDVSGLGGFRVLEWSIP
jgi:SAM-dependent MidA family methyltransferase